MSEKNNIAVVRNKKTNQIYQWLGGNKFKNLVTGKEGDIEESKAADAFVIPVGLNVIVNENPLILDLIARLKLGVEPTT